jgi:hypothetical protein
MWITGAGLVAGDYRQQIRWAKARSLLRCGGLTWGYGKGPTLCATLVLGGLGNELIDLHVVPQSEPSSVRVTLLLAVTRWASVHMLYQDNSL